MRLPGGLKARFAVVALLALALVLGFAAVVLHRQEVLRREVIALSREAVDTMAHEGLASRGRATVAELAQTLANPLYYFDLDAVGDQLRAMLRQPGVAYAVVYDPHGAVLHDGSGDIAAYGRHMDDPLAGGLLAAAGVRVREDADTLDVSAPVMLGGERLGGVRVGWSIAEATADGANAVARMDARMAEVARRSAGWIAAMIAALVLGGIALGWLLQRGLVRPIRELAEAARRIEGGRFEAGTALSGRARRDEVGDLVRAFERMSASIVRHDRDMRRVAYTDALTGLANRLAFREALDRRLVELAGSGRRLALMFGDIDDFKRVNDTLGHDAGDEVLVQCATRIREAVERHGGEGAVLARLGGDEFVVLVEEPPGAEAPLREVASRLAGAICDALRQPLALRGRQVFLGTSVGITLCPDDATGAAMLMKNGDIAMYQAKVAGKNCFRFYSRAMDQAVERRVRLEQDLRGAWERGELSLAFQPVYRLEDRRLAGAEALLRWQHPEYGMVAPAVFIEVAEQSGLVQELGPRVLRAACDEAMAWRGLAPGHALFVSVNVSARQLRDGDLAAQAAGVLEATGLPAACLHVELTETAVIGDELRAGEVLSRLRSAGVKVWLDDFGTGFSGLSHLRRVPVDGVKIDRSFVADVLRDPDDLALTTAIISMAHSLDITVVAEGVEDEGQLEVLRDRGCDLAQGFWLGRPMSGAAFRALLAAS
jgi:diguanylate cyclase (GGDEF)-like protein